MMAELKKLQSNNCASNYHLSHSMNADWLLIYGQLMKLEMQQLISGEASNAHARHCSTNEGRIASSLDRLFAVSLLAGVLDQSNKDSSQPFRVQHEQVC